MTLAGHSCSSRDSSGSFGTGLRHIGLLKAELCPSDNGDGIVEEWVVLLQWLQVFCTQGTDVDFDRLRVTGCSSYVHWLGAWSWRSRGLVLLDIERSRLGWSGVAHCIVRMKFVRLSGVSWRCTSLACWAWACVVQFDVEIMLIVNKKLKVAACSMCV